MGIVWDCNAIAEGLAITREARAGALAHLKELLDEYHGVARPESYYDLVAGNWLDQLLHVTYVAQQRILSGEPCGTLSPVPVAVDHLAFSQFLLAPEFHEYWRNIVGSLLEGDSPADWPIMQREARLSFGEKSRRKEFLTEVVGSKRPAVVFCSPYVKCSRVEWLATLWHWRRWSRWDDYAYPIDFSCGIDHGWRHSRSESTLPVRGFASLVRTLLPLHIPVALLEGFMPLRDALLGMKLWRPRALYTANALHNNLSFKILAAEWRSEGTVLLSHQHGGGYGIERVHVIEEYETRVSDRFYSWGWRRSGQPVQPMSAVIPGRGKDASRHRVLLMCCSYPPTVYRLHFQPRPGTIETMERDTAMFLALLPHNKDLLVRLTASHDGLKLKKFLQAAAPSTAFDESRPGIFQRYAESRLVVHNYLATSWLETLALNIPTVCFFDQNTYAFRNEAQSLLQAMEQVGILHRSAREAAIFVGEVMADPRGWWGKPEVQEARRAFVAQYANFSPDWAAQWEGEFRQWVQ